MAQSNPYPLRIDEDLMEQLKIAAKEEGRSVNKQIEFLIRQYLASRNTSPSLSQK